MKRVERAHREAPVAELTPAQKMGRRLREARLRLSMTQSEVAGDQFSVSYISAVERGQIRPSLGALELLSERLEAPLTELVSDERASEATIGGREIAAERRQEEAEAKLRLAQVELRQGKPAGAVDALRTINTAHLAGYNALELRRLLAASHTALDATEDARKQAIEGIALSERLGDEDMRARLRVELGLAHLAARKTQLALEQFRLAFEDVNRGAAPDPTFRLAVLCNLGAAYWALNETGEAIKYLGEAVELANQLGSPERLGDALWALSVTATTQGDSRRAKVYAQRAIAAYDQADTHRLTARAYARLGRATAQANKVDEALDLLNQAQTMAERESDARGQAEVQRSLAAVFVSQKRLAEAKTAATRALELAQSIGDTIMHAEASLAMAQVQEAQGQTKQAEASYDQAIELLKTANARQDLGDAYALFSTFLEQHGQNQRALEILRQAWNIREGANA